MDKRKAKFPFGWLQLCLLLAKPTSNCCEIRFRLKKKFRMNLAITLYEWIWLTKVENIRKLSEIVFYLRYKLRNITISFIPRISSTWVFYCKASPLLFGHIILSFISEIYISCWTLWWMAPKARRIWLKYELTRWDFKSLGNPMIMTEV